MLRPGVFCKTGHVSVVLGRGENGKNSPGAPVHGLVARAFLGPTPKGQEVLHKNGNSQDNRLANLRFGTRSENNRDIVRHGRRKVSIDDIHAIRRRRAAGETLASLSEEFGVCKSQIGNIAARRHYEHI